MTPVARSAAPPRLVQFDSFTIDLTRRVISRSGQPVHLTAKPLDTLLVLVCRPGETVSKQELMDAVWKDTAVTEDVLVQAIGEIRRALGEKTGENRFVQTVPRQGYRFVMPVTVQTRDAPAVVADKPSGRRLWLPTGIGMVVTFMTLTVVMGIFFWLASSRRGAMTAITRPAAGQTPRNAPWVRADAVAAYGTIHAGGVLVRIEGDENRNAEASLEWRSPGEAFRSAHPLVRIDERHFAGSVFWLSDDTPYDLRVTLRDRDGVRGEASTVTALRTQRDRWPESSLGTLHVSPAGRDTDTGASPEQALRSIQRAAELAKPGDVVMIHPGTYRESVHVRRSGTWIQPIVFRAAGPSVILDGADERIAAGVNWRPAGDAIYVHASGFQTTQVSTEQGRLFRYESLDDLRALRAGPPGGFFADKQRLYLKLSDGSSPAAHFVHAARLDRGFVLDQLSWVSIEGLEFRHFGGSNDGVAVWLRNCTDCRVHGVRIGEVGRAGIWVEGGERGRLENNEIWDSSINRWAWHDANSSSADTHGIFFTGRSPRGYIVRRNRIRGTFNAIAPCGTAPPAAGVTTETDVYDNEISDLGNDAIEAEPYCANVRIWGNRIREVMMGISAAPAGPGPTWILRNVAYRFGAARGREVWLASALKFNTFDKQASGPVLVYHNTFFTDIANVDAVALLEPSQVAFVRARNNVIAGTRHAVFKVSPMRWDGDANALYTSSSGPLVEWLGTPYATLHTFHRATGQERTGVAGPPLLTDPPRGDFTPRSDSGLIDRAVLIPGVNDRFAGRAPDIGAIEVRR